MPNLLVIGSGSAGLTAAIGLAKVGYKTKIIEADHIGGDCTNFGCIPSKTLLHEAQSLHQAYRTLDRQPDQKFAKLAKQALARTRAVVSHFQAEESPEWLADNNVEFVPGRARFVDERHVEVEGTRHKFDYCVVATGSRARIPDIEGLEDTPYLTNKTIFDLEHPPKHLVILGNGVIATEMAEAFAMLGSQVTIIGRQVGILSSSDPDHAKRLQTHLETLGVECVGFETATVGYKQGQFTLRSRTGATITGDQLLVAAGRVPNTELELENAFVKYTERGIEIDPTTQTTSRRIYAIGDVAAGYPNFTHFAYHMGKTVVTNLLPRRFVPFFPHLARVQPDLNPAVIFTSHELAEAGLSEAAARDKCRRVQIYNLDFADLDRAITNAESGNLKVITAGFRGRIVGVSIYAKRAGEILPEFQTLILERRGALYLNKLIRAYPTYTANLDNVTKQWLAGLVSKK